MFVNTDFLNNAMDSTQVVSYPLHITTSMITLTIFYNMNNAEVLQSCHYKYTFNIMNLVLLILSCICQEKGYIYNVTSVLTVDFQLC
jgi:hypothetical protein